MLYFIFFSSFFISFSFADCPEDVVINIEDMTEEQFQDLLKQLPYPINPNDLKIKD